MIWRNADSASAARVLGASWLRVFWQIILPLTREGIDAVGVELCTGGVPAQEVAPLLEPPHADGPAFARARDPQAFRALLAERFREKLSNESLQERIARMVVELERTAGGEVVGTAHEAASVAFSIGDVESDVRASQAIEQETPVPAARRERRRRRGGTR